MKRIRLVVVVATLLVFAMPAFAARRDGKWGCFTCDVVYSPSQLYKEKCSQVSSGQYGNATFCYTITMDFATFCQMEGGACYYIEVQGAKAPTRQQESATFSEAHSRAPLHLF